MIVDEYGGGCDIPPEHLPAVLWICDRIVFVAYDTMLPVNEFVELVYKYMNDKNSYRMECK